MITNEQLGELSKKFKTNQSVIFREYTQTLFLQRLYLIKGSENFLFKGGTAIHLIYNSFRFSEDLDFTCVLKEKDFERFFNKAASDILNISPEFSFKKKRKITGKSYLMKYEGEVLDFPVFVSLDFSFRENPLTREKTILSTNFPIVFSSFVYHLSAEEILAEKIRAVLTRAKGRDFFDMWYLLNLGIKINWDWVEKKMNYYPKIKWRQENVLKELDRYSPESFQKDIRPFVGVDRREKLSDLFKIIKKEVQESVERNLQ